MTLTYKTFSEGLRAQLSAGYDPVRIARWAYGLHLSARTFEHGLEDILLQLIAMDMGEEFELSEVELHQLAERDSDLPLKALKS